MIPARVTFWDNLLTTKGRVNTKAGFTWEKIFAMFKAPQRFLGDREHGGWSAAMFDPCERAKDNVVGVSAIVLDYDGTTSIDEAARLWSEYYGFIHTTRKHTKEIPRFRVILPFGRMVAASEYAEIWKRINAKAGGKLDPAPKDPSRFWFIPGSVDPSAYEIRHLEGQIMDPDVVLDEPDPEAGVCGTHAPRFEPDTSAKRLRAIAYIAKMPGAVSGQHGHDATWRAALALVRGFELSEDDAFGILKEHYNPRCKPPWSDKDLLHKVEGASNDSRVSSGYVLDRDRDWAPRVTRIAPPAVAIQTPAGRWDGVVEQMHDAYVAEPETEPATAPQEPSAQRYGVISVASLLSDSYSRVTAAKPERGAPSGCNRIDAMIGGFRRGMVTVLAAQTSWGKSSFALMASDVGMRAGKRVLLISCEDPPATYGDRLMARRARVNAMAIRDRDVRPNDYSRMTDAITNGEREPFFLNGIGKPVEYLAGAIRGICAEHGTDLVIFDYIQASSCTKRCQDRRNEITHIARTVIDAIKESNAAGLVFSQLKRMEEGHQPTMHDIKESGDVENMAEHILIGWKWIDKANNNIVRRKITLDKNKDGPLFDQPIELPFDEVTASFRADPIPLKDPGQAQPEEGNWYDR